MLCKLETVPQPNSSDFLFFARASSMKNLPTLFGEQDGLSNPVCLPVGCLTGFGTLEAPRQYKFVSSLDLQFPLLNIFLPFGAHFHSKSDEKTPLTMPLFTLSYPLHLLWERWSEGEARRWQVIRPQPFLNYCSLICKSHHKASIKNKLSDFLAVLHLLFMHSLSQSRWSWTVTRYKGNAAKCACVWYAAKKEGLVISESKRKSLMVVLIQEAAYPPWQSPRLQSFLLSLLGILESVMRKQQKNYSEGTSAPSSLHFYFISQLRSHITLVSVGIQALGGSDNTLHFLYNFMMPCSKVTKTVSELSKLFLSE